jgi:CRISPR-associated protein Csy1
VFAPFQPDIASLARQIADSTLDVLVYPELGMDARTFTLAALRLAPVQVAGWGHPVTTGHENIDYFLSCAMMEPEGAQSHYCESLALLPGLGTRYELPAMPAALREKDRRQYQLPEGRTLYLAPQSLFKIHPDNDALFVEILARDPDGVLVFFGGAAATARDIFVNRLRRAFAARALSAAGRVKILPDVSHADYQRINELCDVMLDSMHWSGGNTSLDALSAGLPIVTLPGTFMRGRQSMAMLRMLECDELIAASETEYVEIALRLGRDPAKRKALSAHILQSHHKLFDDASASTAFARFLQRVTQSASE